MPIFCCCFFLFCFEIHIFFFRENSSVSIFRFWMWFDWFEGISFVGGGWGWGHMVCSDFHSFRFAAAVLKTRPSGGCFSSSGIRTCFQIPDLPEFFFFLSLSLSLLQQKCSDFEWTHIECVDSYTLNSTLPDCRSVEMFLRLLLLLRRSGTPSQVLCCVVNVKAFAKMMWQALTRSLSRFLARPPTHPPAPRPRLLKAEPSEEPLKRPDTPTGRWCLCAAIIAATPSLTPRQFDRGGVGLGEIWMESNSKYPSTVKIWLWFGSIFCLHPSEDVPARNSWTTHLSLSGHCACIFFFLNTTAAPNGSVAFSPCSSGWVTGEKRWNKQPWCVLPGNRRQKVVCVNRRHRSRVYKKKKRRTRYMDFCLLVFSILKCIL